MFRNAGSLTAIAFLALLPVRGVAEEAAGSAKTATTEGAPQTPPAEVVPDTAVVETAPVVDGAPEASTDGTATTGAAADASVVQEAETPVEASSTEPVASSAAPEAATDAAGRVADIPLPTTSAPTSGIEVATGERVSIEGKGFSIVPPEGWELRRDFPGTALLMQVPAASAEGYQRTIQILVMDGPQYIDEITAGDFQEGITRRFSESSTTIEDFRVRQSTPVQMNDGRNGLMFYSEFSFDGVEMMQAHILVSSATNHFLMSYTDLAKHFEGTSASPNLTQAWTTLTSAELATRTPGRSDSIVALGSVALVLAFVVGTFLLIRGHRARKRYEAVGRGEVPAGGTSHGSNLAGMSQTEADLNWTSKIVSREPESADPEPISKAGTLKEPSTMADKKSRFESRFDDPDEKAS